MLNQIYWYTRYMITAWNVMMINFTQTRLGNALIIKPSAKQVQKMTMKANAGAAKALYGR